jgi:hypothetical protein
MSRKRNFGKCVNSLLLCVLIKYFLLLDSSNDYPSRDYGQKKRKYSYKPKNRSRSFQSRRQNNYQDSNSHYDSYNHHHSSHHYPSPHHDSRQRSPRSHSSGDSSSIDDEVGHYYGVIGDVIDSRCKYPSFL